MTDLALYTLGVVGFAFFLMLSIGLHEFGHMFFAKKFNAKVTQFFVGFGRTVWSRQKGETEYGIKAIPLGGYVRIIGMLPPPRGTDPNQVASSTTGMFTQVVNDARSTEYETIDPADHGRLFYHLSWWKKIVVMFAGPAMNLVIAFFCFLGVFMLHGEQQMVLPDAPPTVFATVPCVSSATMEPVPCDATDAVDSPSVLAGLEIGDKIVGYGSAEVTNWDSLVAAVDAAPGETKNVTVIRNGEEKVLSVTTLARGTNDGWLGIYPTYEFPLVKGGPVYTVKRMGEMGAESLKVLSVFPQKLANVAKAIVGAEERDPTGPVSIVGGGRFAGEIASAPPAEIPTGSKIATFFMLVGGFNLFLGIINLLPILPLDGGHIAAAMLEGIKNGFAKLLGRPRPAPVDISKMFPIAQAFGLMIFAAGLLLIVADFVVPLKMG